LAQGFATVFIVESFLKLISLQTMQFILFCLVGAFATEVSPVQKVIQLLDDLKGKVANDLAAESKGMEEYTAWCDEEANTKQDAITSSKRTIQDLKATIEDSTATVLTLTSEIDETTGKISSSESDLSKATAIRDAEHKDFVAAEKELVDTVDSLERSTSVLKKNLGFLQSGKVIKDFSALTSGLSKIVEASWVNSQQKSVIQSLIQSQSASEDEDLEFQPQAKSESYTSQSSGILDTIADMQEKAEEALSGARKNEMEGAHSFVMLKQGLEDEIAVMKKQLGEATRTRSVTQEELHQAEASLTQTQTTLKADEDYLAQLNMDCSTKASQWSERQKNAGEETAAIEQAKSILADGVKVFLQTASRTVTKLDDTRTQVVRILKGLSAKYHSYTLTQLSARARSDPFGKIRGLVEGMISKLTKEAAEEADQKSFCDEELSESKAKQADLNGKLDKNTARIEKAEAGKAKLAEEISTLEAEVADIDAGQAESTKLRQEEHAEYLQSSQDFKDSAAAVAKAIETLNNYYNNAALVQVDQPEFGGAKSDIGSTIVSILEVAESDFSTLLAEAESEESSAQTAYEKLTKENAVTKATKQSDAKGKQNEVKQLEVALGNYKENRQQTSDELDAVLAYLDKLAPQCETKVMSYGEKKARREQEIAGLKEALTVLSGESLLQISSLRGIRRA